LFQRVKECLNNCVKHSGATQVKCSATIKLELLTINIEDNGKGVPAEALLIGGNGLNNIRNNIGVIGGGVRCERLSPGTAIYIEVPVMALGQEKMEQRGRIIGAHCFIQPLLLTPHLCIRYRREIANERLSGRNYC